MVMFRTFIFTLLFTITSANAGDLIPVRWLFDLGPMGNHSWVVRAVEDGTFEKHGFDIDLVGIGPGSSKTSLALHSGKADVGYHDFSGVVLVNSRNSSPGVKAIFVVDDRSQDHVFYRKDSGIKTLDDLDGKLVGAYATSTIRKVLPIVTDAKPNIISMNHGLTVPALVSGEVDAILAFTTTGIFNLKKTGFEDFGYLPVSGTLGFPVGRVITASYQWLERYPGADAKLRVALEEALMRHLADPTISVSHLANPLVSTKEGVMTEIARARYNIRDLIITNNTEKHGFSNAKQLAPRLNQYIDLLVNQLDLPHKHNYLDYYTLQ